MIALNRIYTRQGDDGTSGLVTGARRSKADLRFEAIGTVDETNAAIGMARLHAAALGAEIDAILGRVQNDLFDLGADLATPEEPKRGPALRISETQVHRLESEIDRLNAALTPLRSFVLPGGTPAAAALHLARTICRRAERLVVGLRDHGDPVSPAALSYVNRLGDLLFVLARAANDGGAADVLWVPGENR
jgi:cob(I)alamin adenosyltransferase